MAGLPHSLDKLPIRFITGAIIPGPVTAPENSFEVIQDDQAAMPAQLIKQQRQLFIQAMGQIDYLFSGQKLEATPQNFLERWRIEQRAPDDIFKLARQC